MTARAQDKRVWLAGGAALAVLMIAVGWLMVISPQLSSAKTLRSQAVEAQAQNTVLAAKVVKLKRQNGKVGALKASLRSALLALPFDTGLPTFTRQLADQASANKVVLSSITVGAATAPVGAAATAAPTPAATGSASSSSTAPLPSAPAAAAAAAVVAIPVTLLSTGSSANQLAFLKAIQVAGPRRALVTSTTVGSGATGGGPSIDKSATMTTQLTVFTAPLDAATRAGLLKLLK